jgi:RNA polymerase sigma-70 factor (ECF subfamily)
LARAVAGIVPPKDVEDVVQETYVRVCQSRKGAAIESPRSFLFKTARNIALNYVNQAESRLVRAFDEDERTGNSAILGLARDTLDQVCSDEDFVKFCEAVRHLPLKCRRTFVLKKVYGYTQQEIAIKLNISEKTVEAHISKGQARCRKYLLARQLNWSAAAGADLAQGGRYE